MSNEGSKEKKNKIAGFTSIDNRLMAKQDITIQQKVLLSQVVSMMNSTGRFNASNEYISATTGFNQKTISKAFKVFNERGWLYHKPIPGGGRWVIFNKEHRDNLKKYIGTVEEHKQFLESLKKTYGLDDIPTPDPMKIDSQSDSNTIEEKNLPQPLTISEKQVKGDMPVTDDSMDSNLKTNPHKSVGKQESSPSTVCDRDPSSEELKLINADKTIEVIYEEFNNMSRSFSSITDAVVQLKRDRPKLTPLKVLLAITEGMDVEPHLQFRYKEDTQSFKSPRSA